MSVGQVGTDERTIDSEEQEHQRLSFFKVFLKDEG